MPSQVRFIMVFRSFVVVWSVIITIYTTPKLCMRVVQHILKQAGNFAQLDLKPG